MAMQRTKVENRVVRAEHIHTCRFKDLLQLVGVQACLRVYRCIAEGMQAISTAPQQTWLALQDVAHASRDEDLPYLC